LSGKEIQHMNEANAIQTTACAPPGKYLTFQLGGEIYGLEILKVQEIIGMMPVTHVPRVPEYMRGVINLRGRVIPVIELRRKFGLEPVEDTARTCIVVVQVSHGNDAVTMSLLVDEVREVVDVAAAQVEPPPSFGSALDTSFIMGMGKIADRVVMLLDVDKVLSTAELVQSAGVSGVNG
jgi:purine-binding chemotaxis protein CheW